MKLLKKDLQTVLESLKMLTQRVERMQKRVNATEKKQAQSKQKAKTSKAKSPAKKATAQARKTQPQREVAYGTFLNIIGRSKKGVTVPQLKAKTGFNEKKIANLVYKAKKQGKIKKIGRGVYVKA